MFLTVTGTVSWELQVVKKKMRQSQIVRQTIKEVSGRKNTSRAKLKAAYQERLLKWKNNFKNLLGNPPEAETTDKPIQKIINGQLDVKLG